MTDEEITRRFDRIDEILDERFRENENLMRQQLAISSSTQATLAALNTTNAQILASLDAMRRRMDDIENRIDDRRRP